MRILYFIICVCLITSSAVAQKKNKNLLPPDLMTSKIVTFEYEDLSEYKTKKYLPMKIIMLNLFDEVAPEEVSILNAELTNNIGELPLDIAVIKRTELESYIEKGYKYLLTEQKSLQSRVDPELDYGTEWQGEENQMLYRVFRYAFFDLETLEAYYFYAESPTRLPYNIKKVLKRINKEFGK